MRRGDDPVESGGIRPDQWLTGAQLARNLAGEAATLAVAHPALDM